MNIDRSFIWKNRNLQALAQNLDLSRSCLFFALNSFLYLENIDSLIRKCPSFLDLSRHEARDIVPKNESVERNQRNRLYKNCLRDPVPSLMRIVVEIDPRQKFWTFYNHISQSSILYHGYSNDNLLSVCHGGYQFRRRLHHIIWLIWLSFRNLHSDCQWSAKMRTFMNCLRTNSSSSEYHSYLEPFLLLLEKLC